MKCKKTAAKCKKTAVKCKKTAVKCGDIMEHVVLTVGIVCIIAAIILALISQINTRKSIKRIENMLERATEGEFTETSFDESELSALETKFAHYLSASALSSKNVKQEKDRINSLIADISHQTKTPIANLLLYSELLMEEDMSDEAKSQVIAIYNQSEKLRFLIDSLVKMSRLENGIIALNPEINVVGPMLESIASQYMPKAGKKGLELKIAGMDAANANINVTAVFDPKWTTEAIANIVDNAIKYTEKGSVIISAKCYEMFARIDIADTGCGIAEENQNKIFSRFYRAEDVRNEEGVGIGLYLARQIVSGEGGYITVKSVPGEGSCFSVFLPMKKDAEAGNLSKL